MSTTAWIIVALMCVSSISVAFCLLLWSSYLLGRGATRRVKKLGQAIFSPLPASIRKALRQARRDGKRIMVLTRHQDGQRRSYLAHTLDLVDNLLMNLTKLEQTLRYLYSRGNLTREIQMTTAEIIDLQEQKRTSSGNQIKTIQGLIESKEQHRGLLQNLLAFQQKIELTIRQNATILSSTHAELMLLTTRDDVDNKRFHRLNTGLSENSAHLQDLLVVMDEMNLELVGQS